MSIQARTVHRSGDYEAEILSIYKWGWQYKVWQKAIKRDLDISANADPRHGISNIISYGVYGLHYIFIRDTIPQALLTFSKESSKSSEIDETFFDLLLH